MKKLFAFALALILLLCSGLCSFAEEASDYSGQIEEIVQAKIEEVGAESLQGLVDAMAQSPAGGNEWWIIAIRNYYDGLDYSLYRTALEEYAENSTITLITSKERVALALLAVGSESVYPQQIYEEAKDSESINALIFALHLANNGAGEGKALAAKLLSLQCSDGGFPLQGLSGDCDITAMAMQALAPWAGDGEVAAALQRAFSFLASAQLPGGGFRSYGNYNPEVSAQVVIALAACAGSLGGAGQGSAGSLGGAGSAAGSSNTAAQVSAGSLGAAAQVSAGSSGAADQPAAGSQYEAVSKAALGSFATFYLGAGQYSHTEGGAPNATSGVQVLSALVALQMSNQGENFYVFGPLSEGIINRGQSAEKIGADWRLLVCLAALAVSLVWAILLLCTGKRKISKFIAPILFAAIVSFAVYGFQINSTGEYYQKESNTNAAFTTISIYCNTVQGQKDYIPSDGIILEYKPIEVPEGTSVYNQLVAACKEYEIQMEADAGSYICGIANLYEMDFGDLSGWMFKVNGEFSSLGCNQKKLTDGDYVEWVYTLNLGKDVDGTFLEE